MCVRVYRAKKLHYLRFHAPHRLNYPFMHLADAFPLETDFPRKN